MHYNVGGMGAYENPEETATELILNYYGENIEIFFYLSYNDVHESHNLHT